MGEEQLRPLAVLLGLFPDSDSIPKVAVPVLRQLVLSSTGEAESYLFGNETKSLTFPDGVVIQTPHSHQPEAYA